MTKYFKVKPEFDGRVIEYLVPDGRKRTGYRQEQIELIGYELLSPKKYAQIVRYKPYIVDAFDEVQVNIYTVYRSFGALFQFGDSDKICGEYWSERNKLQAQFTLLYVMVRKEYPSSALLKWLSIETLQFAIDYYRSLQEAKNND